MRLVEMATAAFLMISLLPLLALQQLALRLRLLEEGNTLKSGFLKSGGLESCAGSLEAAR